VAIKKRQDLAVSLCLIFVREERGVAVEEDRALGLGEAGEERAQPGAVQPGDDRLHPVHDLNVVGFPDRKGSGARRQQVVIELGRLDRRRVARA
jgi:hypothetical protein